MNTAKQHETFISYSRQDKEFALEFAREMKSAGYSVWLDQLNIPTGARWDDEVEGALRDCKVFLVILTPASVSSENVKDEIGYAIDHGKRIMPVLLKECAIPLRLRRFQYIDFTRMEFGEGIKRAKQLLETLLDEPSTPAGTVHPDYKPKTSPRLEATPVAPLPDKNKPVQRQWIGVGTGILACAACIGVLGAIFLLSDLIPSPPTQGPTAGEVLIQTATEQPTEAPSTTPPATSTALPTITAPSIASPIPPTEVPPVVAPLPVTDPPAIIVSIPWTIDTAGVCRDDRGDYPNWTAYNMALSQCQENCQNNSNCQGFAMSKERNYCQLFGLDGQNGGSNTSARITRGDQTQPQYSCYLKSNDQSILKWIMDSTGVCRDDNGEYPHWTPYDNVTLSQCQENCQNNPNCQGFAMSKERTYCQLFGSDGQFGGTNAGTRITRGNSSQPQYSCFIKR